MGEIETTKHEKKARKALSEFEKQMLLAELAPSLAVERELVHSLQKVQGQKADMIKGMIARLDDINSVVDSTQWDVEKVAAQKFDDIRMKYKEVARAWGVKKEAMLEQAALMLANAMQSTLDINARKKYLMRMKDVNRQMKEFLIDVIVHGEAVAVARLRDTEMVFGTLAERLKD